MPCCAVQYLISQRLSLTLRFVLIPSLHSYAALCVRVLTLQIKRWRYKRAVCRIVDLLTCCRSYSPPQVGHLAVTPSCPQVLVCGTACLKINLHSFLASRHSVTILLPEKFCSRNSHTSSLNLFTRLYSTTSCSSQPPSRCAMSDMCDSPSAL